MTSFLFVGTFSLFLSLQLRKTFVLPEPVLLCLHCSSYAYIFLQCATQSVSPTGRSLMVDLRRSAMFVCTGFIIRRYGNIHSRGYNSFIYCVHEQILHLRIIQNTLSLVIYYCSGDCQQGSSFLLKSL